MSSSSDIEKNRITAHCLNEMKLEVTFLEPKRIFVTLNHGAVSGAYPLAVQEHFRISGDSGNDYLTLLYPKSGESSGLTVLSLPVGPDSPELQIYKVLRDEQALFLLLVNGSENGQTFSFQANAPLLKIQDMTSHYPDQNGQCHIQVDGGRLAILIEIL
jgi:hypothetical protein